MIGPLVAYCRFVGNAGGPVVGTLVGCTVVRAGVGLYDITLSTPIDRANATFDLVSGAEPGSLKVTSTSDAVKRVTILTAAGVATDTGNVRLTIRGLFGGGIGL